jgi:hypothetical protein
MGHCRLDFRNRFSPRNPSKNTATMSLYVLTWGGDKEVDENSNEEDMHGA